MKGYKTWLSMIGVINVQKSEKRFNKIGIYNKLITGDVSAGNGDDGFNSVGRPSPF